MGFQTLSPEQQDFVRVAYEKLGYTEGLKRIQVDDLEIEQTANELAESLSELDESIQLEGVLVWTELLNSENQRKYYSQTKRINQHILIG